MNLSSLLYTALFTPSLDIKSSSKKHSNYYKPELNPNLEQYILYETFIPIESIVFYIGAYSVSYSEIDSIIKMVLDAKKALLRDRSAYNKFHNYSDIVKDNSKVGDLILKRNKIIDFDKSGIFKYYILEAHENMKQKLNLLTNETINTPPSTYNDTIKSIRMANNKIIEIELDIKATARDSENLEVKRRSPVLKNQIPKNFLYKINKDEEYRQMIYRIRNDIHEYLNISKRIRSEKEEFYRSYKSIDKNRIKRTKIALSLGGSIINMMTLQKLSNRINIQNKTEKMREWLNQILKVPENLELKIGTKSFIDQKIIVREFLENLLTQRPGEYDAAFEVRSNMMKAASMKEDEIEKQNRIQDKYIKELLYVVENMKNEKWIIKFNKNIADDLLAYLLTGQLSDKKVLLDHFKNG